MSQHIKGHSKFREIRFASVRLEDIFVKAQPSTWIVCHVADLYNQMKLLMIWQFGIASWRNWQVKITSHRLEVEGLSVAMKEVPSSSPPIPQKPQDFCFCICEAITHTRTHTRTRSLTEKNPTIITLLQGYAINRQEHMNELFKLKKIETEAKNSRSDTLSAWEPPKPPGLETLSLIKL